MDHVRLYIPTSIEYVLFDSHQKDSVIVCSSAQSARQLSSHSVCLRIASVLLVQARCDGSYNGKIVNGYTQAWDFASTTADRFQLNMWINDTYNQENAANTVPPSSLRINKVAPCLCQ